VAGMGILGPSAILPKTFFVQPSEPPPFAQGRGEYDVALALAESPLLGVIQNVSLPSD
jgi:hypothetical protein